VPTLFHVAPAGRLTPGARFKAQVPQGLDAPQRSLLKALFPPDGAVSLWGAAMLASPTDKLVLSDGGLLTLGLASLPDAPGDETLHVSNAGREALRSTTNRVIELVFELVRQGNAPTVPSRLNSLFAYESKEQAEGYRTGRRSAATHEIWSVDVSDTAPLHRCDGGWLAVPADPLHFIGAAMAYWHGAPAPQSVPHDQEILVPLDAVTVIDLVGPAA
jgi:hypothetical protein